MGGVWNHATVADKSKIKIPIPQTNAHLPPAEPIWHAVEDGGREPTFVSPLYSGMETNIPKMIMEYANSPFGHDKPLFPTAGQVLEYLEDNAKEIKHLIHFQRQVQEVKLSDPSRSTWAVTIKDLQSGDTTTTVYDAVVAANGHYDVPYVPPIKGIEAWNEAYPGALIHSKQYDRADDFTDKKVIVVGFLASGVDIGGQISRVCRKPLIISERSDFQFPPAAADYDAHGEIVEFLSPASSERSVRFADGAIEKNVDAVVFCTGYFYAYPFLSSLDPPIITDGHRALNVYQQLFYNEHPTLAFTILPQRVAPFPLVENQAAVFARVWSGRLQLPSKSDMRAWEDAVVAERGPGKGFHLIPYPLDAEYLNFLYDWADKAERRRGLESDGRGLMGVRWGDKDKWIRSHFADIKRAFASHDGQRHSILSLEQLGFDPDRCTEPKNERSQDPIGHTK